MTVIHFPTADEISGILATYPTGSRGRRHLERVAAKLRERELREEIARKDAATLDHMTAMLDRCLEDDFAEFGER